MPNRTTDPSQTRDRDDALDPTDAIALDLDARAREQAEHRGRLRRALAVAVVLHAGFLILQLPALSETTLAEAPQKERVYVMTEARFRPTVRDPVKPPERRKRLVPMPDPDPDDPEPLRTLEIEVPDTIEIDDVVIDFPQAPPPPEPSGPIELRAGVEPPERIVSPMPAYTELARKTRIQGFVVLRTVITKEGRVADIEVEKGLPMGLTESTLEAVAGWRFRPATLNGMPVAVYYTLRVQFSLN